MATSTVTVTHHDKSWILASMTEYNMNRPGSIIVYVLNNVYIATLCTCQCDAPGGGGGATLGDLTRKIPLG